MGRKKYFNFETSTNIIAYFYSKFFRMSFTKEKHPIKVYLVYKLREMIIDHLFYFR